MSVFSLGADLKNGFGDYPRKVVETITVASATGLVGGSIEDSTRRADSQDLGDTISRLQSYQEAGADVLYAPGVVSRGILRQ